MRSSAEDGLGSFGLSLGEGDAAAWIRWLQEVRSDCDVSRQHMESVRVHKEKIRVPATRNGGKI